tara:strand:+ start:725 stop:1846 length:1122 start_codon:yes stop_codon:yes gene_type:complete
MNKNAVTAGLASASLIASSILLGSRGLRHFDPALTTYALGSILAAFAVGYRFHLWYQRPPSRTYFVRAFQILVGRLPATYESSDRLTDAQSNQSLKQEVETKSPYRSSGVTGVATLGRAVSSKVVAQGFIRRRSLYRWIMHLCLSGGSTLAFAITFPLVFGWVHFTTSPDDAELYRAHLFGFQVDQFSVHGLKAAIIFNLLNVSAVIVMVGLIMAAFRRATDAGEKAVQTFAEDILPLILILAVTATGLMLTVSYKFLSGHGHGFMAFVHMLSVLALLIYIPFGKLFHMFQRLVALCVSLYQKQGGTGAQARCRCCNRPFASRMHVDDLKTVLEQLGFNYQFRTQKGSVHYQEICPRCRRKMFAVNQGRLLGR